MDEMKKCPFCGEMIRNEAVKCRFCHEMLNERPSTAETAGSADGRHMQNVARGGDAMPPPVYTQTVVMQRNPNDGKGVATATIIILLLAIVIQAVFSVIPLVGPIIGAIFYSPLYLTAFILSIVCMCKSRVLLGLFSLLAILIVPWVVVFGMPVLMLTMDSSPRPESYWKTDSHVPYDSYAMEKAQAELKRIQELAKKAENGDVDAQYELGCHYEAGTDDEEPDYAEAEIWIRKAAGQGHEDAKKKLVFYDDLKKALAGDARAQWNVGEHFRKGVIIKEDDEKAAEWFLKSAEQGDSFGEFSVAICYYDGEGLPEDLLTANRWFRRAVVGLRKAAAEGDAESQQKLGACYDNGRGVAKDPEEAIKWFRKSAEQGYSQGQFSMGHVYLLGREGVVEPDYDEAVKWLRLAVAQDNSNAQNALGYCYEHGYGVQQSRSEAIEWYRKAADQNNKTAKENLRKLQQ